MTRKLWLEMRAMFWLVLTLGLVLTVSYTGIFVTSKVHVFSDHSGFGMQIGTDYDTAAFRKEYPQGRVYSLREAPNSYFPGFEVWAGLLSPFAAILLCASGILTESDRGTSFVLTLPPSRRAWLWHKAAIAAALCLIVAAALCVLIFVWSFWLQVPRSPWWLLRQPMLLCLAATPWIGVSLFIQTWTLGLFRDVSANAVMAATITTTLAGLAAFFLPSPLLSYKWWLLTMLLRLNPSAPVTWGMFTAMLVVGATCMHLAIRRFERMDF